MIDINRKEKLKWFDFEEDEAYRLKYLDEEKQRKLNELSQKREQLLKELKKEKDRNKQALLQKQIEQTVKDFSEIIFETVIEWKGVTGNGKALECNKENKDILFNQSEYWSIERLNFVISKIMNPKEFFNIDLKN